MTSMRSFDMEDLEVLDELIIDYVTIRIPILKKSDPDELYTSAELCVDFWEDFKAWHTVIGKHIKALSENGKLPIEPVDRTSCNKWLYRLK